MGELEQGPLLPAGIAPGQPAEDLAAADTASRGCGRKLLCLLPQGVLLSDWGPDTCGEIRGERCGGGPRER